MSLIPSKRHALDGEALGTIMAGSDASVQEASVEAVLISGHERMGWLDAN